MEKNSKLLKDSLTKEQRFAFDEMMSGKNMFLTGEAGTGKSYITQAFIEQCEKEGKNLLVTAPTGIAAINVGGTTLHKAFQVGFEPHIEKKPIKRIPEVIMAADTIVIDEISMCRIDLFEYVVRVILAAEERAKKHKQLIVIGDFFQLPPVTSRSDAQVMSAVYPASNKYYAFESQYWQDMEFEIVCLKDVIRQNDKEFIRELNKARVGDTSCVSYFNRKLQWDNPLDGGIILCSTNKVVAENNEYSLNELPGRAKKYPAAYTGDFRENDCLAEKELKLKKGARVMALINDTDGLYQNGSLGTVKDLTASSVTVEFDSGVSCIIKKYTWSAVKYTVEEDIDEYNNKFKKLNTEVIGKCTQIPLKLAYAITIHKSQGQTFDKVNLLPFSFDVGQLYVALSRVRSLSGLVLLSRMTGDYLKCDSNVIDFYENEVEVKAVHCIEDDENDEIAFTDDELKIIGRAVANLNKNEFDKLPDSVKSTVDQVLTKKLGR